MNDGREDPIMSACTRYRCATHRTVVLREYAWIGVIAHIDLRSIDF